MAAACVDAEPFVLRVTDDSMAPALPRGTVVVIDPSAPLVDGGFVVLADDAGPLLRRLRFDGGRRLAVREDGAGPAVAVEPGRVVGMVVQRAGRRRAEHRRLD